MEVKKVLMIEDDKDILRIGKLSLERVGKCVALTADNAAAGIELAKKELPDAILLDVMMPGMDGIAALKKLRDSDLTKNIPIIFLTARVNDKEIEYYMNLGINGVIAKPFDPMTLPAKVKELI